MQRNQFSQSEPALPKCFQHLPEHNAPEPLLIVKSAVDIENYKTYAAPIRHSRKHHR
jgi:hypothetical protein